MDSSQHSVDDPSRRWTLGWLMFAGVAICYLDRVSISHTIVPMADEFDISPGAQGVILSAFSWGYVLAMPLGGSLVDRVGPRRMAAGACLAWSAVTLMTSFATGFVSLIVLRVALGVAEAPIFTANARVVRAWFPLHERGRATALFDSGSYVGAALAAPLSVKIIVEWGWRWAFAAFSVGGAVWAFSWLRKYPKEPKAEHAANDCDLGFTVRDVLLLLRLRPVAGAAAGFFCYNYLKSFFLTWFPAYLVSQRGFSLLKVGWYALIPPGVAILGENLAGRLTDRLIQRGRSVTFARRVPLVGGLCLSSTVVLATLVASEALALLFFTVSYTGLIAASPSIWAIPGDLARSRTEVGRIGGAQNTVSNVAGIVAPVITGLLYGATGSFVLPLALSALLVVGGALSYVLVVGELRPLETPELARRS